MSPAGGKLAFVAQPPDPTLRGVPGYAVVAGHRGDPTELLENLDEIARGLALGKVVFPVGTKYLGERR